MSSDGERSAFTVFFCFLCLFHERFSAEVIDQLLRCPSAHAAMAELPLAGLCDQLLLAQGDLRIAPCQFAHDLHVVFLIRPFVADGQAEARHQAELFLHGVAVMQLILVHVAAVAPCLPDQVAAVAGGVDEDVFRPGLHSAFDDGLQEFIVGLEIFEREVVHIDDEPVAAQLEACDQRGEILELMAVDLDHAQAVLIKLVDDRLDAGGFAGAAVSVKQDIVGAAPFDEGARVVDEQLFLHLIADQVAEHDVVHVADRQKGEITFSLLEAEGAVEGEYAGTVSGVEVGQRVIHLFRALAVLQLVHHLQHHLADAAVVHALALGDGVIVGDQREAVEIQPFFETAEVIVEQFPEHLQILQDEQIDRPLRSRLLLADQREGILVGHEQPGQITVPQIAVEPAFGRQIEPSKSINIPLVWLSFFNASP